MVVKEQDLTGETLSNYKIIGKLGRGGMATVYKAHELSLNRFVALKVLSPKLSEDTEYIKRFQREAQAAAQLNHPNIVQIYAIGEEEGIHYFAMENIKGKTLADIKREKGNLEPHYALNIIKQVAEALNEAHQAGLIHRDIKPSNIMIDSSGRAKVTDFGIAYVLEAKTKLTRDGSIIGTPEYLSPEQCEGKPLDGRSDIYSLGVTLYELLSGKTPYEADTPVGMLMKIVKGNFQPINEVNPDIPTPVQYLVNKMMNTSADERFANAKELIDAILKIEKSVHEHQPVVENLAIGDERHGITTQIEAKKPKGQNRNVWNAVAITAIILILLGGAFAAKVVFFKDDPKVTNKVQQPETANEPDQDSSTAISDKTEDEIQVTQLNATKEKQNIDKKANSVIEEEEGLTTGERKTRESKNIETDSVQSGERNPSQTSNEQEAAKIVKKVLAPPANSMVVTCIGDDDKADIITAYTQTIFSQNNFLIIDGYSVGNRDLKNVAQNHLVVTVKHMGSSTLQYYGQTSEQYTVGLTMKGISTKSGAIISGPFTKVVKYTSLNAEENLKEAIMSLSLRIQSKLNN